MLTKQKVITTLKGHITNCEEWRVAAYRDGDWEREIKFSAKLQAFRVALALVEQTQVRIKV